jgi:protoporphyrin/coproporphyrin ferrochelatase
MISEKLLLVNFGGPRTLEEVEPFLVTLLTDRDVIASNMPDWLHRWFFTRVAKKRVEKVREDYQLIGGGSPIFQDTEFMAEAVGRELARSFLTFHRYLPSTHDRFVQEIRQEKGTHFVVFPMFPQFSYTTTGSIARWFATHLPVSLREQFRWVKSYCDHPAYITVMETIIREFLTAHQLNESETILLFSAHGLPKAYVDKGDQYQIECQRSFSAISQRFCKATSVLTYQSKFGKGEWLRPYTEEWCQSLTSSCAQVVVIPLSFTSDHIETLFEIEYQYLPLIRQRGLAAYRLPALNRRLDWIRAIGTIIRDSPKSSNSELF